MAIKEVPVADEFQDRMGACQDVQAVLLTDDDGNTTGERRTDRVTGHPIWQLSMFVRSAETGRKGDVIHVKVPHPVEPDVLDRRVRFEGFRAKSWAMLTWQSSADGGLAWSADSVAVREPEPSSGRAAVGAKPRQTPPPPPPAGVGK